jgi:23S rRNA (cytosine1962-C5)-methyltransferase
MNKLLAAAIAKRAPLRKCTTAMRLVNSAGDGLAGLILDQYNGHFSAQLMDPSWTTRVDGLAEFLQTQYQPDFFIIKDRSTSAGPTSGAFTAKIMIGKNSQTTVQEYAATFTVDLNDGLNTGLFLDMRANRQKVCRFAAAKKVLNCFAYTCSFGVQARLGQARSVVNVDISKKALDIGRKNYCLNGLPVPTEEFVRADVRQYLQRALKIKNHFDLIIIDPPSFARAGDIFQVKKELPALVAAAMAVLNPGGALLVSTNYSALTAKELKSMVGSCAKRIKQVSVLGQDVDFPGTNTFKESYLAAIWAVL